jgi:c-di-GMP-binding flagellar brake protein YcgR
MNEQDKKEARRIPRLPVRISAMLSSTMGRYGGMMLDLSSHGCRVNTGMPLTLGATLQLQFAMPPSDDAPVHIEEAIVRWAKASQFGLEFLAIAPQHETSLLHMVSAVQRT